MGYVLVEKGKIVAVSSDSIENTGSVEIEGMGKMLFPGCFDPHVHFRDPGFTYKEDFHTGSLAAVSAGITSVFDMPNTNPPVFTVENLEQKRKIAESKSVCNYGLFFGAGEKNVEEIKKAKNVPGVKLYLNSTTGNLKMNNETVWRDVFQLGKKVVLHAEGETFFRAVEIWKEEEFPCELHLCHASLRSEIDFVREMKKNPQAKGKISVEVCPHHLLLTHADQEKYGAICCMKPLLAMKEDLIALWEGVSDGTIDFFATDHAPHTLDEKKASDELGQTPIYGVPGVETFFPLLFTQFQQRNLSFQHLANMTSLSAKTIYHVQDKKGLIEVGFDADIFMFNPSVKTNVEPQKFFSKSPWSPFDRWDITGKVEKTFVGGRLVFDQGKIIDFESRGNELRFLN
ncbi:amidohydrolase family protein [Candidatus Gracilibacteria bacterium]|nr:amidohydrolase family protein [Candidatus Gracilibacteria bacterium]